MRRLLMALAVGAVMAGGVAVAQVQEHYCEGVEGLMAASLPPPGWYFKSYNLWYTSKQLNDKHGDDAHAGFKLDVLATVERFLWISDYKLLGGDYGADVCIPFVYEHVVIGAAGIHNTDFALGDINVEPLIISWHGKQWDASFAMSFFMPTGDSADLNPFVTNNARPGKDSWSLMTTAGATVYADEAKTVNASVLARYETSANRRHGDVRQGDSFHFEWGVGKMFNAADIMWNAGLAGYCSWQVSEDQGGDVTWDKDAKDRVFAIGPEVQATVPQWATTFSLRVLREFQARDRSLGWMSVLSITKALGVPPKPAPKP